METSTCHFTSKNCSVDPSKTFWMTTRKSDVHSYNFFRIFYTLGYSSRLELGKLSHSEKRNPGWASFKSLKSIKS